jgi:hypothetical protein
MATLRNLVINLLRLRGYKNIAQAIRTLVAKPYRVLSLIGA